MFAIYSCRHRCVSSVRRIQASESDVPSDDWAAKTVNDFCPSWNPADDPPGRSAHLGLLRNLIRSGWRRLRLNNFVSEFGRFLVHTSRESSVRCWQVTLWTTNFLLSYALTILMLAWSSLWWSHQELIFRVGCDIIWGRFVCAIEARHCSIRDAGTKAEDIRKGETDESSWSSWSNVGIAGIAPKSAFQGASNLGLCCTSHASLVSFPCISVDWKELRLM